ncbi:MAG: hypothetical protein EB152_05525, partial [Euryarchaeota archaeon]|nr:hypothetical protein [Euryarchaeota archaeon]
GKKAAEGVAQGIRENANAPVREAQNVGEQMEFAFDESFDGQRVGADQMQETKQGTGSQPVDPNAGQMGMFGGKKQMAGMIGGQLVSMAAFTAPSMLGDKLGEETGKMMQSVGMLSGQFMSFASMLGPKGAIAGAIIGATAMLGSALYGMWRDHRTKISEEAYALGASLGGAADAADKMAAVLGRSTAASRQALRGLDEEAQEVFAQFANAFEDGAGKAIVAELQQLSGAQRTARAQEYLNTAVANKMISEDEIDAFAKALGVALSDSNLASNIVKDAQKVSEEGGATRFIKRRAQERDAAIRNAGAFDETSSLKGYMTAFGAASQGMKQWSEVSAIAKEDYLDGIISYNEYMDTLKEASDAQREYSKTMYDLIGKSPDAKATIDSISNSRVAAGLTTAEQEKAFQNQVLSAQDTARYGEDGAARTFGTNPLTAGMAALQKDVTEATSALGPFSEAIGAIASLAGPTVLGGIYASKDREKMTAEGMQMAKEIEDSGATVAESYAIAARIIGDAESEFSKA